MLIGILARSITGLSGYMVIGGGSCLLLVIAVQYGCLLVIAGSYDWSLLMSRLVPEPVPLLVATKGLQKQDEDGKVKRVK